ncbi:unnamed protein product [Malus baccata var. baccata]
MMEGARIARCCYRAVTVLIALAEHTKYGDVYKEICSRFKDLKAGSFELTYSLPEHPTCLLQSDMDVTLMLMCLSMLKISFVDLLVKDVVISNNEGDDHTASNQAASNHEASDRAATNHAVSSSCMVENCAIDENEHLDNSGLHESNKYLSQGWKEYISHEGQKFMGGVDEFRGKLGKYAVGMGFRFVYLSNDKARVIAECSKKSSDGCKWRVCASVCRANGFFYIKTLNNVHSCTGVVREQNSGMITSKMISSLLVDQIREKPSIKPIDIVKDVKQNYGLDISYYNAWQVKQMAKSEVRGDESLSYSQLAWPLLFIDETNLKSKYKGQLIGATGKNGNQGSFAFAFAIVDKENEENWRWFFENLAKVLTPQALYDAHLSKLEGIRIKHMVMMSERSREAEQWRSILCPEMEKTLKDMSMVGRHWNVSSSSDSVFGVHADVSVVVDWDNHFCSCHEWQLKGFPCAHALVSVQQSSGCVYDYIDDYFKDAVYGGSEDVVILPPGNGKGRPRTKRIKTSGEGPRAITCGQCGMVGRQKTWEDFRSNLFKDYRKAIRTENARIVRFSYC